MGIWILVRSTHLKGARNAKDNIYCCRSLNRLRELLKSPHLDVRLSAGEALAVIFELGREFSCDYEQDWSLDLIEILKELATDSNKFRAKKDRKQQRANFRDILRYIEVSFVIVMPIVQYYARSSVILCYLY